MINKNAMKIKNLKASASVYLGPVNWGRVFPTGYPKFLFRHTLMPIPHQFGSAMVPCGWDEGMKPPLCWWQGSLYDWVRVFCIKLDDDKHHKSWHGGVHTHFIPPMVLLPWLSSMSSHGSHPVCCLVASMSWDIYPSAKCMWSCKDPCPLHITWSLPLSSVDAPADIHGRSHSFLLIHPREVFLAWCWVIIRPSSVHGIVSLSLSLGVGLTGVGLVHLSHTWWISMHQGMPASDAMRRSQLWCRMHDCLHWSITSYEGMSVTIWCTTFWGLTSYLSLIFLFPWKASALSRTRSASFKSTAPIFLSLSLCCSLGPGLLKGGPQMVSNSGYIFIHMLGRGAALGDLSTP